MNHTDGFVDALLAAPLGVALLAVLEAGVDHHGGFAQTTSVSTAPTVAAAVEAIGAMSFGDLVNAAVYSAVIETGPWMGTAPRHVANAYRNAEARRPIAEAVRDRFGEALHAPLDRTAQQWWTDDHLRREPVVPLFVLFDHVYGAGQFTHAGLWTVTDPPREGHGELVAAWEYEVGPVSRLWLPVRAAARVFEIHRPEDWARLVTEHPRDGHPHPEWELPGINQHLPDVAPLSSVHHQRAMRTSIRRHLVPDWRSVALHYDGVHLSWAGLLTSEGCITDLPDGDVAMLRYWFSERTLWLADVFGEPEAAPPPTLGNWWDQQPTTAHLLPPDRALQTLLGRSS